MTRLNGLVSQPLYHCKFSSFTWPLVLADNFSADIIGATQDFRHPHFPLQVSALPPTLSLDVKNIHSKMTPNFGIAFSTELLHSPDLPRDFFTTISVLIDYIGHLETWAQNSDSCLSPLELTSRRNTIHHMLLSLPTAAELTSPSATDFYESIRLGVLLFSAAVVFPLPPIAGVIQGLVTRLRCAILAVSLRNAPRLVSETLLGVGWLGFERTYLWLCVLGGVAAKGLSDRILFASIAMELAEILKLKTWSQVVGELKRYLWLDSACDRGGREFWDEVMVRKRSLSSRVSELGIN